MPRVATWVFVYLGIWIVAITAMTGWEINAAPAIRPYVFPLAQSLYAILFWTFAWRIPHKRRVFALLGVICAVGAIFILLMDGTLSFLL